MKVLIISAFPPEPVPEANHAYFLNESLAQSGFWYTFFAEKEVYPRSTKTFMSIR
jgi:hypothetical protein